MGLLLSPTHLHGQNKSLQSAYFYTDWFKIGQIIVKPLNKPQQHRKNIAVMLCGYLIVRADLDIRIFPYNMNHVV